MAGSSIGEINLDLVVNQNQFKRQMSGITGIAKKAGAALAAAFAVKKIVDFGKECTKLGSDLAEVQNVVDVTFPSMTAQVDAFAKSAANSFGLSETMAKKFTGTFGAMAKAFGFSESAAYDMGSTLTGLAGDVASFYNLSQDEAYTKLKSVFTGETETLKDLGVVMTQNALDAYAMANGYGKVTKDMTEAEKVALRYKFVQEQLSAATGDFARTSDSWANQTRILSLQFDSLKATIGQGLINLFTPIIKAVNTLLGKLTVLADAFKSFTELITGNKSSAGSGIGEMSEEANAGLSGAADSASNLADNTAGVGSAAKKAAKEMRALMGFDQVNRLDKPDEDSDKSGGAPTIAGGGGGVDFGGLAQGENVVDKLDGKLGRLINRCKELAGLFKKGFMIGFGDSEGRIRSIKGSIEGIGKSLKAIFTDQGVTTAFNGMIDSFFLYIGKISGSVASVGLTIATNLVGGINRYLDQSKGYIADKLASIFRTTGGTFDFVGDFYVALADVLSVLGGETAQQITADLIGMFSDGFLGALDIALRFGRDVTRMIVQPFVENKDKIKEAIENTLKPISDILSTLHKSIKKTFDKIGKVYDDHVKPMFDAFSEGFNEIVGTLLDGYNTHIAPVLDSFAKKFKDVWEKHVQPVINKTIELFGKLADGIKEIWNKTLQPFINWIAKNIMPIVGPILSGLGDLFLELVKTVSDIASDILDVLGGIIDFIVDVFTGKWEKAWNKVKRLFKTLWDGFIDIVRGPVNAILGMVNGLLKGVEGMVNGIADALNTISIDLPDWLQDLTGMESVGFNVPSWTAPQIPYLAQGGFVERNTPRLAMIGDNKRYGEIVAPENKMQEMAENAVKMALAGHSGISREDLESVVNNAVMRIVAALAGMGFYLDGEQLARAQQTAQTKIDRRWNTVTVR